MSGGMARRDFLVTVAGGVAAAGLTSSLAGCASLAVVRVATRDGAIRLNLDEYPQLGRAGGHVRVQPDDQPGQVLVMALGGRTFAALSPICTHQQCTVEVAGGRLECPCHGSQYDPRGRVLQGPAERDLSSWPTRVTRGGELIIDLGDPAVGA